MNILFKIIKILNVWAIEGGGVEKILKVFRDEEHVQATRN